MHAQTNSQCHGPFQQDKLQALAAPEKTRDLVREHAVSRGSQWQMFLSLAISAQDAVPVQQAFDTRSEGSAEHPAGGAPVAGSNHGGHGDAIANLAGAPGTA